MQADAVCAEVNAEIASLPDPGDDLATFDAYIGRVRQLLATEQDRIDDLDAPDGETPTSMAEYLDRQLELATDLEEAAGEGDGMRVRALLDQSASELGPLGRAAAEATGVTECATTGPVGGAADTTAVDSTGVDSTAVDPTTAATSTSAPTG